MARPKVWLAWSSGKDSAWALHVVRQSAELEVTALLSTITEPFARVSMHAVREELVDAQARATGLPLLKVYIPSPCPNEVYEAKFGQILSVAKGEGVTGTVFGDVSLEDVRAYRERQLARVDMAAHFPLWGRNTTELAREMVASGLRAYLTCVDPRKIPPEFIGAAFDQTFLEQLPNGVNPCGENGEFHTFCWSGPMFDQPIPVQLGETVEREGFLFKDMLPATKIE